MAEKKTCFVIMPITTPDYMLDTYRDGELHFRHVLDCLFIPAVEKAGFEAIPPIAKGSDLIHAEIVNNLERSDLVLCDMSGLNPNVFFEFGIRTSLNKPISIVRDEFTPKVPFDATILNHHEYSSTLGAWELQREIESLAKHIAASSEGSKGENTLWKWFGLRSEAKPYQGDTGTDSKLELMALQLESIGKRLEHMDWPQEFPFSAKEYRLDRAVPGILRRVLPIPGVVGMKVGKEAIVVRHTGRMAPMIRKDIVDSIFQDYGVPVRFRQVASTSESEVKSPDGE